jgi:hypothetical protein
VEVKLEEVEPPWYIQTTSRPHRNLVVAVDSCSVHLEQRSQQISFVPLPASKRCGASPGKWDVAMHFRSNYQEWSMAVINREMGKCGSLKCVLPVKYMLACLLFNLPTQGAIAPDPHWQGRGRRPKPLPASPCSAGAPHLLRLPPRARALAPTVGCPQTSFFSLLCTPVVLTCPWLPEPHSA